MDKNSTDIFERLKNGEHIAPNDPMGHKLMEVAFSTKALLVQMNNSSDPSEIRNLLGMITDSEIDQSVNVFTPIYINYGIHTKIGKNVFINFNCTILDLGGVTIEVGVLIAPNVNILSEGHPIAPKDRHTLIPGPILIKNNAWIGANATILPGVTIGENSIVASGAIVSKDVPDNVIVGGIPARVLRDI